MDLREFSSAVKESVEISRVLLLTCGGDRTNARGVADVLSQLDGVLKRLEPHKTTILPRLAGRYPNPIAPIDGVAGAAYHEIAIKLVIRARDGVTMASYGNKPKNWPTIEKRLFHNWSAVQKWLNAIPPVDVQSMIALLDDEAARAIATSDGHPKGDKTVFQTIAPAAEPSRLTPEARAILFIQDAMKRTGKLPTKKAIADQLEVSDRTLRNWPAFKRHYAKLKAEGIKSIPRGSKVDGEVEAWAEKRK